MNASTEILVVILSIFLAIFLIVGIILTVYLIKVSREIHSITKSAGNAVNGINSVVSAFSGFAKMTPALFVAEIVGKYMKKSKNRKKGE